MKLNVFVDKGRIDTPWVIEFEDKSQQHFKEIVILTNSVTATDPDGRHYLVVHNCLLETHDLKAILSTSLK